MHYRLIAVVLCVCTLTACSTVPEPAPEPPLRLRVLSYNIHHGRGADGKIDLQRLAEVIKRAKPDLVALQEVDVKTKRSGDVDQAAKLGELTGMHQHFAEAMPYQGGGYGNVILTKVSHDLAYLGTVPLSARPGQEPRSLAVGELLVWGEDNIPVTFAGTHLCHLSSEARLAQIDEIWEDLFMNPGQVYVFAGDFNFTPNSDEYKKVIDAGFIDTAAAFGDPKQTYPSDTPRIRIDYVFVRPADRWRVIDVQVLDEPVASDHAPLLVELEYVQP